jgi:hypothetical protein
MMSQVDRIVRPDFIFCPPDTRHALSHDPEQPRLRATLGAQKVSNAWYYALKMNCESSRRVEPHPDPTLHLRKELLSETLKRHNELDRILSIYNQFACQDLDGKGINIGKKKRAEVKEILETILLGLPHLLASGRSKGETLDPWLALLKEFSESNDEGDLADYYVARYLKEKLKLETSFLQKLEVNPEVFYHIGVSPQDTPWNQLSLVAQVYFCERMRILSATRLYGFAMATMGNEATFLKDLYMALKEHGPHCVAGDFGQLFHSVPPLPLNEEYAGRKIYGWKSPASRVEGPINHWVVMVGVNLQTKRIYYIDPIDGSEPDPATQKVYAISYEKFKKFVELNSGNVCTFYHPAIQGEHNAPRQEMRPVPPSPQVIRPRSSCSQLKILTSQCSLVSAVALAVLVGLMLLFFPSPTTKSSRN